MYKMPRLSSWDWGPPLAIGVANPSKFYKINRDNDKLHINMEKLSEESMTLTPRNKYGLSSPRIRASGIGGYETQESPSQATASQPPPVEELLYEKVEEASASCEKAVKRVEEVVELLNEQVPDSLAIEGVHTSLGCLTAAMSAYFASLRVAMEEAVITDNVVTKYHLVVEIVEVTEQQEEEQGDDSKATMAEELPVGTPEPNQALPAAVEQPVVEESTNELEELSDIVLENEMCLDVPRVLITMHEEGLIDEDSLLWDLEDDLDHSGQGLTFDEVISGWPTSALLLFDLAAFDFSH